MYLDRHAGRQHKRNAAGLQGETEADTDKPI